MTLQANGKAPEESASKLGSKPSTGKAPNQARPLTKKAQLIKLLSTKSGATVGALAGKLGWQAHTARAALSGLRKAGHEIAIDARTPGGARRYRIVGAAPEVEVVTASSASSAGTTGRTAQ